MYYVAVIEVVGRRELGVCILQTGVLVDEGIGVLEMMLHKQVVVHRVQHLDTIDFGVRVVHVYLGGVEEAKLEVERLIFGIQLVSCCIPGEERVEVVFGAISQSKEIL